MALSFYDDTQTLFGLSPLRTFHDGHLGGSHEKLIYLRNADVAKYYTNITVHLSVDTYEDLGVLGTTGWGVKFVYGQRQPTEGEWDQVRAGDAIAIPDIGSTTLADTSTYHPIWVRVFCPGETAAQIRENQTVQVFYFERNVGA
jgi:hypothetical protein